MTSIRISIQGQTLIAQLADNPTAHDLADQLPLTLTFRDFNSVEKIADLPRPLTSEGVPAGADPDVNDIGYYAPTGTSSSTTATLVTGTGSFVSVSSTPISASSSDSPTASTSPSSGPDQSTACHIRPQTRKC